VFFTIENHISLEDIDSYVSNLLGASKGNFKLHISVCLFYMYYTGSATKDIVEQDL
jgi:hypothetical protein